MPKLEDFFGQNASRAELTKLNNLNTTRLSRAERMANGKALRRMVPRSSHAEFRRARGRPDPVAVLEAQNATRIRELVPVRMARMLTSPFAFLRGSAAVMAGDLAKIPAHQSRGDGLRRYASDEFRAVRIGGAQPHFCNQRF